MPRFRAGSVFPTLLKRRRRVDRALWAVVMQASLNRLREPSAAWRQERSRRALGESEWRCTGGGAVISGSRSPQMGYTELESLTRNGAHDFRSRNHAAINSLNATFTSYPLILLGIGQWHGYSSLTPAVILRRLAG